jgi:hypothetical protein
MTALRIPLLVSACLLAAGCDLDNELNARPEFASSVASISFHLEPECGFPKRTSDSLTRDTLFYTGDDYYSSKIVYRKSVPESLILGMERLFDSLRIDSLSGLNSWEEPCGPQTSDCRSHNVLRVRRVSVVEYSDSRRCMSYDIAFLKAFAAYRSALAGLRN